MGAKKIQYASKMLQHGSLSEPTFAWVFLRKKLPTAAGREFSNRLKFVFPTTIPATALLGQTQYMVLIRNDAPPEAVFRTSYL